MQESNKRMTEWMTQHRSLTTIISVLLAVSVGLGALYFQLPHPAGSTTAGANLTAVSGGVAPSPSMPPIHFSRPEVEAGIAFPHWNTSAYGANDLSWKSGLVTLQRETGARWVSIVVNLYQDTPQSTVVHSGSGTPTPESLAQGIAYAHHLGLRVFVEPVLTVLTQPDWSGDIQFDTYDQARAWFDGYWKGYQPYVQAAASAGADQLGMATELQALEHQPASLWNTLIGRVRSVFRGSLIYDMNWSSLSLSIPGWLSNRALDAIGISEYQSIAQSPKQLSTAEIGRIWQSQLLPTLDNLARRTGKSLILSEIGYRNSTDALYQPWNHTTNSPADPELQAAAYTGAAQAVFGDKHIVGLFFWAWDNGVFAVTAPAAAAVKAQYLSPAA